MTVHRSLCLAIAALLLAVPAPAAEKQACVPALEDAIRLGDQTLPAEKSIELALPPLPAKPGKTVVLRFRMVSYATTEAGCNCTPRWRSTARPWAATLAGGNERLIGRSPSFEFTSGHPGTSLSDLQRHGC